MEFKTVLWIIGAGILAIIVVRFALGFVFNMLKMFLGFVCFVTVLYAAQGARVYYAQQAQAKKAYAEGKISASALDAQRKEAPNLLQFLLRPRSVVSGSFKKPSFLN
jgi:hypothetical protein